MWILTALFGPSLSMRREGAIIAVVLHVVLHVLWVWQIALLCSGAEVGMAEEVRQG